MIYEPDFEPVVKKLVEKWEHDPEMQLRLKDNEEREENIYQFKNYLSLIWKMVDTSKERKKQEKEDNMEKAKEIEKEILTPKNRIQLNNRTKGNEQLRLF